MARAVRASSRTDTVVLVSCVLASLLLTIASAGAREPSRRRVAADGRRALLVLAAQRGTGRGMRSSSETRSRAASTRLALARRAPHGARRGERAAAPDARPGRAARMGLRPRRGAAHSVVGDEHHDVTLTAGANAGVTPRSIVVAPEGLVGVVKTVDPTMSHRDSLDASRLPRERDQSVGSNAFGIVHPHVGGEWRALSARAPRRGVPGFLEPQGRSIVQLWLGGALSSRDSGRHRDR